MRKTLYSLLLSTCLALPALADRPVNLYTVKLQAISQTLYYSGTIAPIRTVPVVSPTAGVIDDTYFIYGGLVNKGQKLLHVQTNTLLSDMWNAKVDYLNALSDYTKAVNWNTSTDAISAQDSFQKAKRTLLQTKTDYDENKNLYKLGIISYQQLIQSQDSYEDARSSYHQSHLTIEQSISQNQGNGLTIATLKLKNAQQKFDSLTSQVNASSIYSPATGIVLLPIDNSSASDGSTQKQSNNQIGTSNTISYQQVLFNIGDLSGIRVSFNVPEMNIDQIAKNQAAVITGSGFPGITLNGTVVEVAAQASSTGSGVPSFPVVVEVPKITDQQRKLIRAGMDAQIALTISSNQQAMVIPINAVSQNGQGQSIVQVYDSNTNKTQSVVVATGTVTQNNVEIVSGLTQGQQILLPN